MGKKIRVNTSDFNESDFGIFMDSLTSIKNNYKHENGRVKCFPITTTSTCTEISDKLILNENIKFISMEETNKNNSNITNSIEHLLSYFGENINIERDENMDDNNDDDDDNKYDESVSPSKQKFKLENYNENTVFQQTEQNSVQTTRNRFREKMNNFPSASEHNVSILSVKDKIRYFNNMDKSISMLSSAKCKCSCRKRKGLQEDNRSITEVLGDFVEPLSVKEKIEIFDSIGQKRVNSCPNGRTRKTDFVANSCRKTIPFKYVEGRIDMWNIRNKLEAKLREPVTLKRELNSVKNTTSVAKQTSCNPQSSVDIVNVEKHIYPELLYLSEHETSIKSQSLDTRDCEIFTNEHEFYPDVSFSSIKELKNDHDLNESFKYLPMEHFETNPQKVSGNLIEMESGKNTNEDISLEKNTKNICTYLPAIQIQKNIGGCSDSGNFSCRQSSMEPMDYDAQKFNIDLHGEIDNMKAIQSISTSGSKSTSLTGTNTENETFNRIDSIRRPKRKTKIQMKDTREQNHRLEFDTSEELEAFTIRKRFRNKNPIKNGEKIEVKADIEYTTPVSPFNNSKKVNTKSISSTEKLRKSKSFRNELENILKLNVKKSEENYENVKKHKKRSKFISKFIKTFGLLFKRSKKSEKQQNKKYL